MIFHCELFATAAAATASTASTAIASATAATASTASLLLLLLLLLSFCLFFRLAVVADSHALGAVVALETSQFVFYDRLFQKGTESGTLRKHSRSIVQVTADRSIPNF